jgi:hypothetical protein
MMVGLRTGKKKGTHEEGRLVADRSFRKFCNDDAAVFERVLEVQLAAALHNAGTEFGISAEARDAQE